MAGSRVITKSQYTEVETAQALNLTVEHLRVLVRQYIVTDEADVANLPLATYHPADLLLLRFLTHPAA